MGSSGDFTGTVGNTISSPFWKEGVGEEPKRMQEDQLGDSAVALSGPGKPLQLPPAWTTQRWGKKPPVLTAVEEVESMDLWRGWKWDEEEEGGKGGAWAPIIRRGKINIEIPAGLTELLQRKLQQVCVLVPQDLLGCSLRCHMEHYRWLLRVSDEEILYL